MAVSFATQAHIAGAERLTNIGEDLSIERTAASHFTADEKHLIMAQATIQVPDHNDVDGFFYIDDDEPLSNGHRVYWRGDGAVGGTAAKQTLAFVGVDDPTTNVSFVADDADNADYYLSSILMVNVNDWVENTDYKQATQGTVGTMNSLSSGVETTTATMSISAGAANEVWLIFYGALLDPASNARIDWWLDDENDVAYQAVLSEACNVNDNQSYSTKVGMYVWTAPDTASHDFKLILKASSGGSQYMTAHIFAVKLESLGGNYVVNEEADIAAGVLVADADTELSTIDTSAFGSGDVLMIGHTVLDRDGDTGGQYDGLALWPTADANTSILIPDWSKANNVSPKNNENSGAEATPNLVFYVDTGGTNGPNYDLYGQRGDMDGAVKDIHWIAVELGSASGVTTNLTARDLADLSEKDMNTLATDAGVTLTKKSKLGRMRQIASASNTKEYEGTLQAIKDLFGL